MDICEAILQRRVIEFDYRGHHRLVIPAAYGAHCDTGNLSFRGYQIGGASKSGKLPNWRLFTVSEITGYELTDEVFEEDPLWYKKGDKHLNVQCEL